MDTGRKHQAGTEALQTRSAGLGIDAREEKRRLEIVDFDEAASVHLARIERLEIENRALQKLVRRVNAENMAPEAWAAGAAELARARGRISASTSSVQPGGGLREAHQWPCAIRRFFS
jgi:hypothetical protein